MELNAIRVDPAEARAKLAEYAAVLAGERTAQDRALLLAYRAAARGLPVIGLQRTIAAGGFHPDGLPKLAVVRADATECYARWDGSDLVFADQPGRDVNRGALVGRHSVRVTIPGDDLPERRRWASGAALVPLIPPACRPRRAVRRRHILWEVEEWRPVAPRDPALIYHLGGDLWVVYTTWDLTELERLLLTQPVTGRAVPD
jgi:hypothetical protein